MVRLSALGIFMVNHADFEMAPLLSLIDNEFGSPFEVLLITN